MVKRKKLRWFGIFIWIAAVLSGQVLKGSSPNVRTVGKVHISVENQEALLQTESGKRKVPAQSEMENQDICYLNPGEFLEETSRIQVGKGSKPAYLRTKILIGGITAAQQKDLLEQIETDSQWYYQKEDGYFYYQKPVEEGDTAVFSAKVCVPGQWSELQENLCFCVTVLVEAAEQEYLQLRTARGNVFGWQYQAAGL